MPETVISDGWRGAPADGPFGPNAHKWGLGAVESPIQPLAPPEVVPWDWRNEQVGWGLVLPDIDVGSSADRAAAKDAPPSLQDLVAGRGPAPVLRWRPQDPDVMLRYYPGFADPESRARCLEGGFDAFLAKPFEPGLLLVTVGELVGASRRT